ncbi:MAG TPA: lamin tail domain-containing protein, partial [Bacteroidota bacterium]|nr:lamin tail domain-containing protein [Bacteroidota bacterium]
RLAYDLSIDRCRYAFAPSPQGVSPEIIVVVRNIGRNAVPAFVLRLSNDFDHDGMAEPGETIAVLEASSALVPMDSASFSYLWSTIPPGEASVLASIECPSDARRRNDTATMVISTRYPLRSFIVNEIMFDPLPDQCEWIEFYNRGTIPIDLKGWRFNDRPTASGSVNSCQITAHPAVVRPGAFAVVAADSTLFRLFPLPTGSQYPCQTFVLKSSGDFGLNADGDDVLLRDQTGAVIDSVSYSFAWHRPDVTDTRGRSLERVNPDVDSNLPANWTTCVLDVGGSPGNPNSVLTRRVETAASLTFAPNPFSPDGDGFEDLCLIQYRLGLSVPLIHVKIYDIKGRLVRTLANSKPSAPQGELLWDGLNDDRQRVRIGPYIVLIQAVESNGSRSASLKGVVVVATKL